MMESRAGVVRFSRDGSVLGGLDIRRGYLYGIIPIPVKGKFIPYRGEIRVPLVLQGEVEDVSRPCCTYIYLRDGGSLTFETKEAALDMYYFSFTGGESGLNVRTSACGVQAGWWARVPRGQRFASVPHTCPMGRVTGPRGLHVDLEVLPW